MQLERPYEIRRPPQPEDRLRPPVVEPDGAGRDRRHGEGRRLPHRAHRSRPPGPRSLRALGQGGGLHHQGRPARQHLRPPRGPRSGQAAGDDRLASRHPADRRQVRRRLWRDGGAGGAARAARFGLRHRGADRGRGVDQRGGLPLRAGHGGLGRVRRRLHARACARHQGPRRRELRRGAEEDRLRRQGAGRRPQGRRLLRGAYRAGADPRARRTRRSAW